MYHGRGQMKVRRSQKLIDSRIRLVVEESSFGLERTIMMMTLESRAIRVSIGRMNPYIGWTRLMLPRNVVVFTI